MLALPAAVRELVDAVAVAPRTPAYLLVARNGRPVLWGGALEAYGMSRLDADRPAAAQLDFLEGLLPLDDHPAMLPHVVIGPGQAADLHLVPAEDGDWVVLLDVTADSARRAEAQQLAYELGLLRSRLTRAGEGDAGLLADLVASLDLLVLERTTSDTFRLVGAWPRWLPGVWPQAVVAGAALRPGQRFLFLDSFLEVADAFWRHGDSGPLPSGGWTEDDGAGGEHHFQARAVRAGGRPLLLVEAIDAAYAEKRHLLQTGRDTRLRLAEHQHANVALGRAKGELEGRVAERTFELAEVTERLQSLSRRLMQVQETERRLIARELHDEIGQSLTAVALNLQSCHDLLGASPVAASIQESVELVDRVLQQARDLSLELRPSLLDDLGLVDALGWHVQRQAERARLDARLVTDGLTVRPPPEIETACFRVAQEALTNVVRHAGASRVTVELREDGDSLELVVRDDGAGFEVAGARRRAVHGESLGLLGMEERVLLAGGRMSIDSAPGQGTTLRARFPLAFRGGGSSRAEEPAP